MGDSATGNSTDSVAVVTSSLKSFCTLYSAESKAATSKRTESATLYSQALVNCATKTDPMSGQATSLNLNTPLRASSSGSLLSGIRRAEKIKDAVGLELNGNTWWIEPDTMDVMLKSSATDAECEDYRNNYSDYKVTLKVLQAATREADIYEPAATLIQSILNHFGFKGKRTVIDTHLSRLQHVEVQNDRCPTKEAPKTGFSAADLLVTGTAEEFDFTDPKLNNWIQKDVLSYTTCLTPFDAKVIGCNFTEAQLFCQAAMYARACFNSQRHRTFVYVVMINQEHVRLYYFDHCGAMLSHWISFKDDPNSLIRMILLTCNDKPEMVGLDPAFSFVPIPNPAESLTTAVQKYQRKVLIDIGKGPMTFTVLGLTWSSNAIHGRKTTCWLVKDDNGKDYILKECTRLVAHTPAEWEMLEAINKATSNTDGIGKMVGFMRSFRVSELRQMVKMDMPSNFPDRERYFILLEPHGPPISHFKHPMQFLCAFRDAVAGHSNLWNLGILHRDISINNILLGKEGASEGNRGVIIDLDFSVFIDRVTTHFGLNSRTGTHPFQSYMILSNTIKDPFQFPHNHLDDLESFFWVLVWILMDYSICGSGKNLRVQRVPEPLRSETLQKFEQDDSTASNAKYVDLTTKRIEPADGWGDAFIQLLTNLREFLMPKVQEKDDQRVMTKHAMQNPAMYSKPVLPEWVETENPLLALKKEAQEDYGAFLSHIDTAILEYQAFLDASSVDSVSSTPPVTPKRSTRATNDSNNYTVTPGSGSKRLRAHEDVPDESPSAKRNRDDGPITTPFRKDSPKGKGQSTRSGSRA